jgi:dephospho-CoA kinase
VLLVGLTGGIGSGKSTVARMLAARGAVVLDADAFAREAVRAGSEGLRAVVARFGSEVLTPGGELDRPKLAGVVFADPAARTDLEGIVHPEVRRLIADGIQENLDTDNVVVLVNPLLIEMGTHRDCDVVVVVSATPETQLIRSIAGGMHEQDVRARMAAQLPLDERAQHADVILDNEGSVEELERQVDRLWNLLAARAGVHA